MKSTSLELKKNWLWKEKNPDIEHVWQEAADIKSGWKPAHAMPSEIHVELLKTKQIPDPYLGSNEHRVQWVGEREWLYATTMAFDVNQIYQCADLVFEGLDTFCTVYLNGDAILQTDNQFRTYLVNLDTKKLKSSNILLLHFKSAKIIAKELENNYGRVRAGSCNLGDPSRVYVRKAQYDWRWDWGPELLTIGPYRPIRWITYTTRILDLSTRAAVSKDLSATLSVNVKLCGSLAAIKDARVTLNDSSGKLLKEANVQMITLESGDEQTTEVVNWEFAKDDIELWWPVGHGNQSLYIVEVTLIGNDSSILDQQTKTIGFRRVKLLQEPLEIADRYGQGTTFLFEINNVRIFIGGSNWVPADNFLTMITPERFRAWLQLLKDGNQNMVRLWGGGVYEPDVFYDICDEFGILVWQDFQFACGVYPAHKEFVANVKAEAEDNVKRLRHHPSIALFCGNNEDYQQVLQWGGIDDLPARLIYEDVLPEVVNRLTNMDIPYHRGSPYGGKGWDTSDPTIGDIHQWGIWAGERPYQDFVTKGGRFVSEFGMPAMPDLRTIDYWLDGDAKQQFSQSKLMAQHNKAGNHERRFAVVMNENFRLTHDFETHVYHTQMLQCEAVGLAYRAWRREWRGEGKQFVGLMLNDCWPVTSWAIADYFLRPKPAYFTIARELRPYTVGIHREVQKSRENDRPAQFYEFGAFQSVSTKIELWGTNSTLHPRPATLELKCFDLESDFTHEENHGVTLAPNQSTELLNIPCPERAARPEDIPFTTLSYSIIVSARLVDSQTHDVLARYVDWPQPYRYLEFPDPGLVLAVEGENIRVTVERPVKGLVLSVDGEEGVKWSDNALDVMPGDPQNIVAQGLGGRCVKTMYMGKVISDCK